MLPILHQVLCEKNSHIRDKNIQFYEYGHKYTILTDPDSEYTSVTRWNHNHFPKFDADKIIETMMKGKSWKKGHKYWGKTPQQIKSEWSVNNNKSASAGTNIHFDIECFMNHPTLINYTNKDLYEYHIQHSSTQNIAPSVEWSYFLNFIKDHPYLIPYRTEWTIYNEDVKIAGSIDMIYENPDGTLSIYDWKRVKCVTRINNFNKFAENPLICHFPDSNFWHYALQLNTYKKILEDKYDKTIKDMYLVRIYPDTEEENYELIKMDL